MKRVLIISPYFPPANAADMQRVRMSLSYFKEFGWDYEVVTVDEKFVHIEKDPLLLETIPDYVKIHKIPARNQSGIIGGIAFRSLRSHSQAVSKILASNNFDLIYFSTTQFPVCALGSFWGKKTGVPYVIDMQDPWYTGRYQNIERKSIKFCLVYALHRFLERKAIKEVSGLISVSQKYLDDLSVNYPHLKEIPSAVIPFGAYPKDFEIAAEHAGEFANLLDPNTKNIVYIGRGGEDLRSAITPLFEALKQTPSLRDKVKLYFIGTSYFSETESDLSILKLAQQMGVEQNVVELPKRIGYFHTLNILQKADALFIPGSDDKGYNASKIHPYVLAGKPILSILNADSPALAVLKEYGVQQAYSYNDASLIDSVKEFLISLSEDDPEPVNYNPDTLKKYSAENLTKQQCELFDAVIHRQSTSIN